MDPSLVPAKVIGGMLALPVRAELTPSGQWHLAIPRPFIADISPDARRRAFLFSLHFDWCVVMHINTVIGVIIRPLNNLC